MAIIVVGSGPVGFYIAICFAKKGHTVHIIDKYVNNFSRPGVVAIEAGEIIIRQLYNIGVNIDIPTAKSHPETYRISDIQKILYKKATELNVQFSPAHFESIKENSIKIEGSQKLIKCELLVECTGESRAVIRYVNESNKKKIFNISQIADNPAKKNFVAFITMSKEDADLLSSYAGTKSAVNEIEGFEELRSQGWLLNDLPHWDIRRWELPGGKTLVCCYFEIPEEVARADISVKKTWLTTLLQLKAGKKISFEIEPGSLKFRAFEVSPCKVDNPVYQEGVYPFPIVACGDAFMSAEYRKGTGIRNGIIVANGLINAINFKNRTYTLNMEIFNFNITEYWNTQTCIQTHLKEIQDLYQSRKNRLLDIETQKEKLKKYSAAHVANPENTVITKGFLIQIGELKKLGDKELTLKNYEKASQIYEHAFKNCEDLEKNFRMGPSELAKLYNLESRICSNLERTYKNQKNTKEAAHYLSASIIFCTKALELLEVTPDEGMQILKEGLITLLEGLVRRKNQYESKLFTIKNTMEMKGQPPAL